VNAAAYARQLKELLPRGAAWLFEADSFLSKTLLAIADELERVDGRAADLLEEWDPRTADETIEDWERVLGLPDSCVTAIPATLAERRLAVVSKLTSRGGQSRAFFTALALACGYSVTIHEYGPSGEVLRVGFRCGDRVSGSYWAYAWRLDVSPPAGSALPTADFECIIRRAAPAHTTVIFEYL
jgi:uncharacterized protein YmfQ (DUF2313 family)